MNAGISIVAVGACTPVGRTAESTAAAVRGGISRVGEHPRLLDGAGNPLRSAWVTQLDEVRTGPARCVALAVASLREVVSKLSAQQRLSAVLPVFLALPESRPGFSSYDLNLTVRGIEASTLPGGVRVEVRAIGYGHAGGLGALELASQHLARRPADLCVVGGVESYLDADSLDWLDAEGRLAQDGVRGGIAPGEAAGMFAVTAHGTRSELRSPALAHVRSVATGQEPRSKDSPEGLLGEGLGNVVLRTTQELRLPQERVDDVYCDINGERHRTDDWSFMLLRTPSVFRDGTAYVSTVDTIGEVGAASAAISCVLAVQAWRRRYAHGPMALVCASSGSGLRSAALLEKGEG